MFTQDSAAVAGTPEGAASGVAYSGGQINVVPGNASAVVNCPGIYSTGYFGSNPAQKLTGARVGYYTVAQGRANALFTAVAPADQEIDAPQAIVVNVAGLTNGTPYTFFAQGEYSDI
jgi:hypothetical protein